MKDEDYRRAVQSVRWTDAQRRTIEARLSIPLNDPEDAADGYSETAIAISKVIREEAYPMKECINKKAALVLAAAVLTVGGITAGVVLHNRNQLQQNAEIPVTTEVTEPVQTGSITSAAVQETTGSQPADTKQTAVTQTTAVQTTAETAQPETQPSETQPASEEPGNPDIEELKTLGLHLTEDSVTPAAYGNSIMDECTDGMTVDGQGGFIYNAGYGKRYTLRIAEPGAEKTRVFWKASDQTYENMDFPVWAEGCLWRVTRRQDCHAVLLRYEPDGSAVTEVEDLGVACRELEATPLYYRGCLFFFVPYAEDPETGAYLPEVADMMEMGGFKLYAYDLTDGKLVTLREEMPDAGSDKIFSIPSMVWGSGDDLYLYSFSSSWKEGYSRGIYRFSLKTGERKDVHFALGSYGVPAAYCETSLLYSTQYTGSGNDRLEELTDSTKHDWHLVDLKTGEDKKLKDRTLDELQADLILMDETYIYKLTRHLDTGEMSVVIFDHDGALRGEAALPEHFYAQTFKVTGGRMYLTLHGTTLSDEKPTGKYVNYYVYSCGVEEVIAGKPDWRLEFRQDDYRDDGENKDAG